MINELNVKICPDFEENHLILSVDENLRERYLYLGHPTNSIITYSINFNGGLLLLGLNNYHILNSLELNIYRKQWKSIDLNPLKPSSTINGCIDFVNIITRHNEFDITPNVYTDEIESAALIEIETCKESDWYWVTISDNCFVKIYDNHVIGFWINLSNSQEHT